MCERAGIEIRRGALYKPSIQRSTESANKTYKLRHHAMHPAQPTRDWVRFLPDIAVAVNNTRNRSLANHITPYQAHFNRKPHYYYGMVGDTEDTLIDM